MACIVGKSFDKKISGPQEAQKYERPREITFGGLLSGAYRTPSGCGAHLEWMPKSIAHLDSIVHRT
jgi:hypothetical protein